MRQRLNQCDIDCGEETVILFGVEVRMSCTRSKRDLWDWEQSNWRDQSAVACSAEVAILKSRAQQGLTLDGQTTAELVKDKNPVVDLKHSCTVRVSYPRRFRDDIVSRVEKMTRNSGPDPVITDCA